MITLTFGIGGGMRRVIVDKKKMSLISAETNFVPLTIDLSKVNDLKSKEAEKLTSLKKLSDEDIKFIKELGLKGTEKEISSDIIKDFQRSGWRLVSKR